MKPPRRRGRIARMLFYVVPPLTLYLLVCLAVFIGQRKLLYYPRSDFGPQSVGCDERELDIQGPDGRVQAWLLKPELLASRPLVIYCGGNAEQARTARLQFVDHDWPSICWNYPGYGGSAGGPSETAIIAAGRAVLAEAKRIAPDARIVLMGRSLGAAVACALAAEQEPTGLILASPSASMSDVAAGHYPMLPTRLLMLDSWRSAERVAALHCPLLALVAADDRTIPPHNSHALFDAYPAAKQLRLLEGRDHNDIVGHSDYWPAIAEFVDSL